MVSSSPHPMSASGADPVTNIVNAGATFWRNVSLGVAGATVVAASPGRHKGVYINNESTTIDAHVATSEADYTAGNYFTLYQRDPVNDSVEPSLFVPGNQAIWMRSASSTINVSGYYV